MAVCAACTSGAVALAVPVAVAAFPEAAPASAAHHVPSTACPVTWPGCVSLMKVYSGQPAYVSCVVPSERLIVPNAPLTPATVVGAVVPWGTSSGGQYL